MANIIHVGGGGGGSTPTLIAKSITQNGTYNAIDDNADGYSSVDVDVEGETKTVFSTVKLFSGKITNTTGVVVEDSNYMYTDYLPLPEGDGTWYGVTFDLGLNSSQTYAGLTMYNADKSYNNYWNPNARFRFVDTRTQYTQGARWFRLSFPVANLKYVFAHSWGDSIVYCADEPSWITNGAEGVQYVDISTFAYHFKRNTTTPTVTKISDYEYSLSFQDQNATGYELCSFSVSLDKGVYVAEIKATVNKNTGLANQYPWGIYSATTTSGEQENSADVKNKGYTTYVPFDKTDTNEHYYEVPVNVTANGTAYICFAMADDNGVNATVTVSSLKIRKAYGSESSGSITKTLEYSFDLSQGGAWLDTQVDITDIDVLMFEREDNSNITMQTIMKVSDIAVYTGGQDVYTTIYHQDGKAMNARIYNNVLYVSYQYTSSSVYKTNVYSLSINDYIT